MTDKDKYMEEKTYGDTVTEEMWDKLQESTNANRRFRSTIVIGGGKIHFVSSTAKVSWDRMIFIYFIRESDNTWIENYISISDIYCPDGWFLYVNLNEVTSTELFIQTANGYTNLPSSETGRLLVLGLVTHYKWQGRHQLGAESFLHVKDGKMFSNIHLENVKHASLRLRPPSTGVSWTERGSQIAIGPDALNETGEAALRFTYSGTGSGDYGYSYIGMGGLSTEAPFGVPGCYLKWGHNSSTIWSNADFQLSDGDINLRGEATDPSSGYGVNLGRGVDALAFYLNIYAHFGRTQIGMGSNISYSHFKTDGTVGFHFDKVIHATGGFKCYDVGATVTEFSIDGTFGGNSDSAVPTEKAVKTYVDAQVGAENELSEMDDVTITAAATNDFLIFDTNKWVDKTVAQTKSILSLDLVENTALSTWVGTSSVTTLGTISSGTWNGTVIGAAHLDAQLAEKDQNETITGTWAFSTTFPTTPSAAPTTNYQMANKKYVDDEVAKEDTLAEMNDVTITAAATNDFLIYDTDKWVDKTVAQTKTILSLSNVENVALSTWSGTTYVTTVGTVSSGTWEGTVVDDAHVANDVTLTNITQITNRSHTSLTSIGTYSHATIDTHLADSTKHFLMLDEDNMASNDATKTATQQSIKAYVDDKTLQASGNREWVPLAFIGGEPRPSHYIDVTIASAGSTNFNLNFSLVGLPMVLGTKNLYVDRLKVEIVYAEATSYLNTTTAYGVDYNSKVTLFTDPTNKTTQAIVEYDTGADQIGGVYSHYIVKLSIVTAGFEEVRIGGVSARVYYA